MAQTPSSDAPRGFAKWAPLVVLASALFIIIVDTTLLNVSLKYVIKDLGSTIQQIQWVITVYSLVLAALTITGGRLGDIFGRKRMFLVGAVLFALGSFIAAISQNFTHMLIGEAIIEGLGAALMMPATASLLLANYHGRDRALAFAIWGSMAGVAAAVGPILGGWLTTNYSWRYGFLINVVIVAVVLIASRILKDDAKRSSLAKIDFGGVVLSSVGLLSIVFGIIEASTYGWWKVKESFVLGGMNLQPGSLSVTPIFIVLGLVALVAFYFWEKRMERHPERTPLLTLDLLKNSQFMAGVYSLFAVSLSLTGFAFIMPVFYQSVLGFDAFHSGLANLPLSVALLITAPLAVGLSRKITPKNLVLIGMVFTGFAVYWVSRVFSVDATAATFAPALALFGIGMGLVQSQINNLALSAVPLSEAGEASGVSNTSRQLGSALGAAILGSVLISIVPVQLSDNIAASTVLPEASKVAISQKLTEQGSNIEFASPEDFSSAQAPAAITNEIQSIVKKSITEADKTAALYASLFVILGFFAAFRLPKRPAHSTPDGAGAAAH